MSAMKLISFFFLFVVVSVFIVLSPNSYHLFLFKLQIACVHHALAENTGQSVDEEQSVQFLLFKDIFKPVDARLGPTGNDLISRTIRIILGIIFSPIMLVCANVFGLATCQRWF